MTTTPRTAVEALAFLLSEAREGAPWRPEKPHEDDPEHGAFWLTNDAGDSLYIEVADVAALLNGALTNEAADERLRAAVRAWVDYWDARTELWDAVGKCGHDPTADCPEMDAIRAQGTDDKVDRRLRQALANSEPKP